MNTINIYKIAKKEINFNFFNYWILLSATIFCITNFIIIYFGEAISGDYSQTDIRSMSLSIIHLQMYLIPLLSFILSYDSILSEKESGTLDLLLSYKINFIEIIFGKLIGNSIIFTLSFIIGFLPIIVYLNLLGINISILIKFTLISIWLNMICNSIAIYISNSSTDRTFVILISIFIWLFFIFIYDILFIFTTVVLYGIITNDLLNFLIFLNPVEIFRIMSIILFMPFDANELLGINIEILNKYIYLSIIIWTTLIALKLIIIKKKN